LYTISLKLPAVSASLNAAIKLASDIAVAQSAALRYNPMIDELEGLLFNPVALRKDHLLAK
jgi:hypothetical protein